MAPHTAAAAAWPLGYEVLLGRPDHGMDQRRAQVGPGAIPSALDLIIHNHPALPFNLFEDRHGAGKRAGMEPFPEHGPGKRGHGLAGDPLRAPDLIGRPVRLDLEQRLQFGASHHGIIGGRRGQHFHQGRAILGQKSHLRRAGRQQREQQRDAKA